MKKFFTVLVYLSFVFLACYFYKKGFFDLRGFRINVPVMTASIFVLWSGFLLSAFSWRRALALYNHDISREKAIYSHGIQIFTKYIPGKIWTILGRASFAMPDKSFFKEFSFISLKEQLIYIWTGLLISIIPLMIFYGLSIYLAAVSLLFLIITGILFNKWFHHFSLSLFRRMFRRDLDIPFLSLAGSRIIILYCLGYWAVWMLAFYLMSLSVYKDVSPTVCLIFPLSVTLGLLALIFPGGVGVREGILAGFMILIGIPAEQAATISMLSRLWFIVGELLMFLSAQLTGPRFKLPGRGSSRSPA